MMEFEIVLNDLRFYAFHGVYEEERLKGNDFLVNLSVFIPVVAGIQDDELANTVSYADLFEIVKEEMVNPCNLLETLALKIARRIRKTFPEVVRGRVSIEKKRPPITGMEGSASVALSF